MMYWLLYWRPLYLAKCTILIAADHQFVLLENLNIYIKHDGYHLSNANVFRLASFMHIILYHRIQCRSSIPMATLISALFISFLLILCFSLCIVHIAMCNALHSIFFDCIYFLPTTNKHWNMRRLFKRYRLGSGIWNWNGWSDMVVFLFWAAITVNHVCSYLDANMA